MGDEPDARPRHLGVSVVIPTFNSAETIARALSSVLAQTRPPEEVIVVDDGSSDATLEEVADFPFVQVILQENAGPARARNRGLLAAHESYVAFLDADDYWHPNKLALQLEVARLEPRAVLIAADWEPEHSRTQPWWSGHRPSTTVLTQRDILILNRFQTSTVLLARDVAGHLGGFDNRVAGVEDWDLWLRAAECGLVLKIDAPLVRYTDTPGSYSKDGWRVYTAMCAMLDRELPLSGLSPARQREVRAWHHLRFAVSFTLAERPRLVLEVGRRLVEERLLGATPRATATYLIPFLLRRRLRALRARLDLASAPGVTARLGLGERRGTRGS